LLLLHQLLSSNSNIRERELQVKRYAVQLQVGVAVRGGGQGGGAVRGCGVLAR